MSEPLTLAIETSNPASTPVGGAVALVRGEPGESSVSVLDVEGVGGVSRHEDALAATIQRLAGRLGVGPGQIDRVAVSIGPGGYTALRIAVTTAKVIGEAVGAALFGVPTALGVLRRLPEPVRAGGPVAICLAWKRGDVWVQRFAPGGTPEAEGRTIPLAQLATLDAHHLVLERRLRETLLERRLLDASRAWSEPVFDPVAVFEASASMGPVDPAALLPLYPREPEAVTKWRALRAHDG